MANFMFTSVLGVFVCNETGKIVKKRLFSDSEQIKYQPMLKENKWISPELEMIKGVELFLGFKTEKKEGIKFSQDVRKLDRIELDFEKLRLANTAISKQEISDDFSEDSVIMHAIRTYDETERVVNALVMRLRDFTKQYAPIETDKAETPEQILKLLRTPPNNLAVPIKGGHIKAFLEFSKCITELETQKETLEKHLELTMKRVAPNLLGVGGALISARLISLAGSLKNLAKMTYSKLQVLGAEKAMFRHVKKGSKTPKHGIIINHEIVASAKLKGRAARGLAEKLSHAARLDYFKGENMAEKLLADLIEKLK